MSDQIAGTLPSIAVLGPALVVAMRLTLNRVWVADRGRIRSTIQVAAFCVAFQATHFSEELLTGLHSRLPAFFGLPPMSLRFFVVFNVVWLVIWSLSSWGLSARHRAAVFPLWFLGIGCVVNGVAHPLLAMATGDYFPGLVTSPLVGVMGLFLLRQLLAATRAAGAAPSAV